MFELADSGNKAYAIVNFRIETYDSLDVDAEGGGWTESVPVVKLMWIDIRSYKKEGPGKETETASFGQRFHSKPQTTSFELPVPKEDLDQYRAMMEELAWYDQALRDPSLFPSDVTQLSTEKKALETSINDAFGDPVPADETRYEDMFPDEMYQP
jgi:hypothetical protein